MVVLPLAALLWESQKSGAHGFWQIVSSPEAVAALKLTFGAAFVVVLINAVLGTITAWVLSGTTSAARRSSTPSSTCRSPCRRSWPASRCSLSTARALPSARTSPTREGRSSSPSALTLPFVVRTVQPVLLELDVEMEEAARSLGAGQLAVFRRIVLPNLLPGILSGVVLALARALGEIGSIVVISGDNPFHTEVASVFIYTQIQTGYPDYAAAIAVVLLGAAFVLLLAIGVLRFYATRHERA